MRGKPIRNGKRNVNAGITPADAGKTARRHGQQAGKEDHPRGCGENRSIALFNRNGSGSPPRMRGKPAFSLST